MGRLYVGRQLMAVLQPLTGDRSSGTVQIKTVDTVSSLTLKKNRHLFAIRRSEVGGGASALPGVPFRLTADIEVTPAGVDVGITSVLGGLSMNHLAGTTFGICEPDNRIASIVATTDIAGGTSLDGFGAVAQVAIYEQLGAGQAQRDLFLSKLGRFPAVVLVWESTGPGEKIGPRQTLRPDRWSAHVVVSRADAGELRAGEGLAILDVVEELIGRRAHVDDEAFTSADVQLTDSARLAITDTTYIYSSRFEVRNGLVRRDDREFSEWLSTSYTIVTRPPDPALDPPVVTFVDAAVYDQDPSTPLPDEP